MVQRFLPSPSGKGGRTDEALTNSQIFLLFQYKTPTPTAFNGPSSHSWARVLDLFGRWWFANGRKFLDSMILATVKLWISRDPGLVELVELERLEFCSKGEFEVDGSVTFPTVLATPAGVSSICQYSTTPVSSSRTDAGLVSVGTVVCPAELLPTGGQHRSLGSRYDPYQQRHL